MRLVLSGIRSWRHDLTHCLHTTFGVLLGFHGLDPLHVLGSGWGFAYRMGDVRREEYYFPCLDGSLLASLAPHHQVASRWHQPSDAIQGWAQVRAAVAAGQPVAVAADNFHLPFRPAFGDVHTNHLMTVYGFDDEAALVWVADPVPPAFNGPITVGELTAARDSGNPIRHDRDMFFTANPIANRWITVEVAAAQPALDVGFVREVLLANVSGFLDRGESGQTLRGLEGLRQFLSLVPDEPERVDEIFIVAGAILAITGLHADFLADAGRRLGLVSLVELGRMVDRVAHHWTALRIGVANARSTPLADLPLLRERGRRLLADQEAVLDSMARVGGRL
ncbi:MAG TPA: BtrH N-terminal domain-containing protein [Candidatus Limnocylindrales bacterium]|nr:BtrH N-terminal domain-containing protein [Candidatus Limnocylindrales bacterium]